MTAMVRGGAAVVLSAYALVGCAPRGTAASPPRHAVLQERPVPPVAASAEAERAPCEPASAAHGEAEKAFARVSALIEAAHDPETLREAKSALSALRETSCFSLSLEQPRDFDTDSVLAFKTWWHDGGRAWVGSYLALLPGPSNVVLPPDVRRSLAPEDLATEKAPHPLAAWMCPTRDEACGTEARAWRRRATVFFDREGEIEGESVRGAAACAAESERHTYPEWRRCLEKHRVTVPALPLGDLRAPKGGWLLLESSSRGGVCLAKRAYHLDSGAAHQTETCRPAARDGAVGNAKDAVASRKGHASADNVREALWMLLLADHVEQVQVASAVVPIPEEMKPAWPLSSGGFGSAPILHATASSHGGDVAWRWLDGEKTLASGTLTRSSSDRAFAYASALVDVADAGFVDGKSAVPPPRSWR